MRWTGGHVPSTFRLIKRFFEKNGPGGRVVSAATWQAWGLGFDSSQSRNFFRRNQESRTYIYCRFELNFEFEIKLNFFGVFETG